MVKRIIREETDASNLIEKLKHFEGRAEREAQGRAETQATIHVRDDSLGAHLAEIFLGRARALETHQTSRLDSTLVQRAEHVEVKALDTKTGEEIGEVRTEAGKFKMSLKEATVLSGFMAWFQNLFTRHAGSESVQEIPQNDKAAYRPENEYVRDEIRHDHPMHQPPIKSDEQINANEHLLSPFNMLSGVSDVTHETDDLVAHDDDEPDVEIEADYETEEQNSSLPVLKVA